MGLAFEKKWLLQLFLLQKERNESGEKRKGEEILKKKDFFGK